MQTSITGDALFAQVVMQRQVDARLCLIVEGDDELAVLTGHIDDGSIFVLMGGGKPALLRVAVLLDQHAHDRALALVDRDLDDFTGKSSGYPASLLATTGYDLDADILGEEPDLLRRAAVAQAGPLRVSNVERACATDFTNLVTLLADSFTGLRLLNEEEALELSLRSFPFSDAVGRNFRLLSNEKLLDRANSRSAVEVDFVDVEAKMIDAQARIPAGKLAAGGHDIFAIAAAILRKAGAKSASHSQLSASVHTAVSCLIISKLRVYREIEDWAARFSTSAFTC